MSVNQKCNPNGFAPVGRVDLVAGARLKTITIIGTYQCTAACTQCCFESSPEVRGRLELDCIQQAVNQAKVLAPNLEVAVFSGGEISLLKNDLFSALRYCHEKGLKTRIVTNASWGKSKKSAFNFLQQAKSSMLTEMNISTGNEHAQWVPIQSILNAIQAASDLSIPTVVTIEGGPDGDGISNEFHEIFELVEKIGPPMRVIRNSWMEFKSSAAPAGDGYDMSTSIFGPCRQLFSNIVVTPHKEVSACCGLTFEHIPEMKMGSLNSNNALRTAYENAVTDFAKIWLSVEGPAAMLKAAVGEDKAKQLAGSAKHICEVCAILHHNEEAINNLKRIYTSRVPEILNRFEMKSIEG